MLVEYIAIFPEAWLFFGIIIMCAAAWINFSGTCKTFYAISKWSILPTIFLTAVFYDRNIAAIWENNDYTTFFKIIIYLFSLSWITLLNKRFQNREKQSFIYYVYVLISLLCYSIGLSSREFWLTALAFSLCQFLNVMLAKIDADEESLHRIRYYRIFVLFFCFLLWIGILILYYQVGSSNYSDIFTFLTTNNDFSFLLKLSFVLIMLFFLFAVGVAPFHFWFAGIISGCIFPVAGFLTIIPSLGYFPTMINLLVNVLAPFYEWFVPVMVIFGVLSIFIGAIGANSEENLHRLFAYAELYYIGVFLTAAADMQNQSLIGTLIYLLIYVFSFFGIYTVFSGCRNKGEYVSQLKDIRGLSTQRPFLSAAFLGLMISLIGMPPLLGFLGKLSVINSLVAAHSYGLMAIISFSILILACAYLKVITVIYFEPRNINFDRVDKNVYIYIVINILLIAVTILNPKYLIHDVEMMLAAIL